MGRIADGLDVAGAEALLHGGEAAGGRLRLAHEVGLELDHAGAREEQRRVARRHERRAGHAAVSALFKEALEGLAQFVGVH